MFLTGQLKTGMDRFLYMYVLGGEWILVKDQVIQILVKIGRAGADRHLLISNSHSLFIPLLPHPPV